MRHLPRVASFAVVVVTLFSLAGCGADRHDPLRPSASTSTGASGARPYLEEGAAAAVATANQSGFYPLTVGNAWRYATHFEVTLIDSAGNASRGPSESHVIDRVLDRVRSFPDREYIVEDSFERLPDGTRQYFQPILYRQDQAGLYELDSPPDVPGARPLASGDARARRAAAIAASFGGRVSTAAVIDLLDRMDRATGAAFAPAASHSPSVARGRPGGVLSDEITRLSYPMHPGTHWVIRADPLFDSTVEAIEAIDEPAGRFTGARIRIHSDVFGPRDNVHTWYGRDGYLRLTAHLEGVATDDTGRPVGTFLSDIREDLIALHLVR